MVPSGGGDLYSIVGKAPREPRFESCGAILNLGQIHSALFGFIRLYE